MKHQSLALVVANAALAFPAAASAAIDQPVNSGAEDAAGIQTGWGQSNGWSVASYGEPGSLPAVESTLGSKVFKATTDGATLTQTFPFNPASLGGLLPVRVGVATGASAGDDAYTTIDVSALDADGQQVATFPQDRGPTVFDRTQYGLVQFCHPEAASLPASVRSLKLTVTAHIPSSGDAVFADGVNVNNGQYSAPSVPYPGKQTDCQPLYGFEVFAAQALLAAQPRPQPQPVPVATVAPKTTLKSAASRLGSILFTLSVNTAGTYRVVAKAAGVTVKRSVTVAKAGSVTFKVKPSKAQSRKLRAALKKGSVKVKATVSGSGTTVSATATLRR